MTDCPNAEIRDQLPLLAAGRLDPASRTAVAEHLAGCAECRAELALLERVRSVTSASPAVDTTRIAAAVRAARATGRLRRRTHPVWTRWRVGAAAAAAALLALLVRDGRQGVPIDAAPTAVVAPVGAGTDSGAAAALSVATDAGGLTFGGGLSDLTETELESLATSIAEIEPLPLEEPQSIAPEIPFEPEETI